MAKNSEPVKRPKKEEMDATAIDQSDDSNFIERRVIRLGYLSIQSFLRDKRDEIATTSSKKFLSIINEVDEMHYLVKKPREQVSDAEALRDLANSLMTSIKVHSAGSVSPSLFVSSLISEYGKNTRIGSTECAQILWKDIGLHVSPIFMKFQGSCTMLGQMGRETITVKVSGKRKRRRTSVKEEKVKPEEVEDIASKEKTETEKTIATMFNILKSNKNVGLENLILNRISFAQTVENLFALSFLVKDGRVIINVDEKGSHHVSPRNAPASAAIKSGKVAYSHFVFRFGFDDWKLMKELVAEGSELMPHRIKVDPSCKSEPNSKENNIRTTKTQSRNHHIDIEDEMNPNGSYEIKKKWRLVCA